ncbi:MAG: type IV secretion system DNA-binding domain-containing protein [Verrucomicrobiota bacterium]
MSSIGRQFARELTAQFYRWELRGRGWFVWPYRVGLEPPFRPFEGHYLPQRLVADDGRIESVGSRIASGLSRLFGTSAPAPKEIPEEIKEPDAERVRGPGDRVELQIALPPEYRPEAAVFGQMLESIGDGLGPISFEVVGTGSETVVQITVDAAAAALVKGEIKAFFPEAVVTAGNGQLFQGFVDAEAVAIVELGLEREFMVPLQVMKGMATDPLVGICGALESLKDGEIGVLQVLLESTQAPWAPSMVQAVSWGDGRPFFANDSELVSATRNKVGRPLYAAVVRLAVGGGSVARTQEIMSGLSGALKPVSSVQGNRLIVLPNDDYEPGDHFEDLVSRTTHRNGLILNSDELTALVHLPTAAVRAKKLRRVRSRSEATPWELTRGEGALLGRNDHEGVVREVFIPDQVRLNHCHVLGGTGSGKSTFLARLAFEDIRGGRGVAVIDPHGDLVDLLLPHIPENRLSDVILFDPTDDACAIAFNPLAAASERERDLLATDFIAVMKQNTSGWGDQMSSLLGNAVLAFLHSTRGGTLPELRRFLSDKGFRQEFLQSVTNPEVVYFWEAEAGLSNKTAVGSILTRLDSLLRYESLIHILGQRRNLLDFAEIMDSKKIFLGRLAKGLIGESNAYLLGSLLVSRFYQTTIARQSRAREERTPYFLLMDEAGDLLTSTVSEILKGTRKYGLGLTLAHQSLSQLKGDAEVFGSVVGNTGTKVCFQVGGDDARKMAEEFGGFVASDLMNLPPRHAVARVGPRDRSFNLEVSFLPDPPRPLDEAYRDILEKTRARYSTPRDSIRADLSALRGSIPKGPPVDPFAALKAKQEKEREEASSPVKPQAAEDPKEAEIPTQEKTSARSEVVKGEIIRVAGALGFSHESERVILGGATRVDLVLKLRELEIAVQIAVTSPIDLEVLNLKRCLDAGFREVVLLCDATVKRRSIEERFLAAHGRREEVTLSTVRQFCKRLQGIAEEAAKAPVVPGIGTPPKAKPEEAPVELSETEKDAVMNQMLREIQERLRRAKGEGH